MKEIRKAAVLCSLGMMIPATAGFAQVPTQAELGFGRSNGNLEQNDPHIFPMGTVLMDQLYHVDDQLYTSGNGNCWGGNAVFGSDYDLQLCDDMDVDSDFEVTDVTTDSVGFLGGAPVALRVALYADDGGSPSSDAAFDGDWSVSSSSSFTDTVFGLLGVRATASGESDAMSAGHYWVMGQPDTANGDGDWYYSCRGAQDNGGDSYGRDGDRANGGYGTTDWVSMNDLGFGPGDTSMQVMGNPLSGGLTIRLEGECPGEATVYISGAEPYTVVVLLWSLHAGEWTIPVGPCDGTVLDIMFPHFADMVMTDRDGNGVIRGSIPECACGRGFLQAIEWCSCETSNVIAL